MKVVPMFDARSEQSFNVRSVLICQVIVVLITAVVILSFAKPWLGVLYGGFTVMVSTWHVHKSVHKAGEDKVQMLKAAGFRFAVFLLALAVGIYVLSLHPFAVIVGMFVAYAAMYVISLMFVYKNMKGDGLG